MLRDLLRMWRKIDLLKQALDDFITMIDHVEAMFRCATETLFGARKLVDAREMIYKTDIKVNISERNNLPFSV